MNDFLRLAKKTARRGVKAARLMQNEVWRRGLRHGVGASIEHNGLPFRDDYATIIDIGAHQGQFALYSRGRFPQALLYCFEPLERPRRKLLGLLDGDSAAHVIPLAAGDTNQKTTIHVSRSDDSSSILAMTPKLVSLFPGANEVRSTDVEVVRLDDHFATLALPEPVLLKIDVQGYELSVLKGALSLLRRVDSVLVECSFVELYSGQALFEDVYRLLRDRGFALRGGHVSYQEHGVWLQGDFLFQRPADSRAGAEAHAA